MLRLNQVKIKTEHSRTQLVAKAAEILHVSTEDILDMKMIRRSVDARKKPDIFWKASNAKVGLWIISMITGMPKFILNCGLIGWPNRNRKCTHPIDNEAFFDYL